MPITPKNASQINKKVGSVNDLQIPDKNTLILIALENGQKVAHIPIDDMPNDKFLATIQCQELMGRIWEFELEENLRCRVCGKYLLDCLCPICPICEKKGNPNCQCNSGIVRQIPQNEREE